MIRLELVNEAATLKFGAALAEACLAWVNADRQATGSAAASSRAGGGTALRLWLRGELGTGKTTLTRGLLAALGHAGSVRSPSYTLVEPYETGRLKILHVDLYRLQSAEEALTLGIAEQDRADTLWVVEWPEHAGGRLGAPDLEVELEFAGAGRAASIEASGRRGIKWLEQLEKVLVAD